MGGICARSDAIAKNATTANFGDLCEWSMASPCTVRERNLWAKRKKLLGDFLSTDKTVKPSRFILLANAENLSSKEARKLEAAPR